MQIGRVSGHVVSTLKHAALVSRKLLLVQPYDLEGQPRGRPVTAIDVVDAGTGDWVLVLDEGSSASQVLENPRGPVRTLVVGVVDAVHLLSGAAAPAEPRTPPPAGSRGESAGDAPIHDGTRG